MYKLHFVKFIINEHGDDDDDYAIVRKKFLIKFLMTTHSQRALILYRRRRFINHLLTYDVLSLIITFNDNYVRSTMNSC